MRDPARLQALRRLGLLDAPPDPALDRLTLVAQRVLHAPAALVCLLDADRQIICSAVGLPEPLAGRRETPLSHSLGRTLVSFGHALAVGDLNADGNDEIVAGFRGRGYQLYVFTAEDTSGLRWRREILDAGTIAAADCKIEDLNGDGRPDIACVGASTGNVKIYENQGR